MDWMTNPESWIALLTLTVLEIVLGIDNVIFISILVGKLAPAQQPKARRLGLGLAMFLRIGLLASLVWMARLTAPLFSVLGRGISGRDLILLAGGLFLLTKATREIHDKLEGEEGEAGARVAASFAAGPIGDFVARHPTVKMLALAFLILIGMSLLAEGLGQHIPKGYVYFAMAFSVFVEFLNLRMRKKQGKVVKLHEPYV